ncbi:hypothetical protein [Algoriella sp.]|uniref:hypothetical protein n=1 Tax=Algoriella sp. TaxID=1872434 RepID=UPI002FC71C3A
MKKTLIYLFLPFILLSCTEKNKKENFQNEVYSQIFQEIIDSCVVNIEPIEFEKNITQKEKDDYNNEILKIRNQKRLIVIYDTVSGYGKEDFDKNISKNFRTSWSKSDSSSFVININNSNIKANNILIKASKLPNIKKSFKEYKSWKEYEDLKNLDVQLSFKRIFFNNNQTKGFLQLDMICGKLCGQGYDIWIQKVNNKWEIHKIERTWFS